MINRCVLLASEGRVPQLARILSPIFEDPRTDPRGSSVKNSGIKVPRPFLSLFITCLPTKRTSILCWTSVCWHAEMQSTPFPRGVRTAKIMRTSERRCSSSERGKQSSISTSYVLSKDILLHFSFSIVRNGRKHSFLPFISFQKDRIIHSH